MPPPFRRIYDYFRHDAAAFMQANRTVWTKQQRSNTISTLWAGHPTIQEHYAGSEDQNPGPGLPTPNPIPDRPYTGTDATRVKRTGQLPDRAQSGEAVQPGDEINAQGPVEPQGDQEPVEEPEALHAEPQEPIEVHNDPEPDVPRGDLGGTVIPEKDAPALINASVDKLPYDFWPQLPWGNDPILPALEKQADGKFVKNNDWLRTRPHMKLDDEQMWHGAKILGAGGYGVAGLWVEVDEHTNITQTMVIKDTQFTDRRNWRDPMHWRSRVPREIRCHQLVEQRRAAEPDMCRFLIRFLGYRLMMTQMRYRTYLEHCEAGDLFHAMSDHDQERTAEFLPEAFIWYMMKALATACLVLHHGTIADEPVEEWRPITHLDITPGNVLLGLKKRKRDGGADDVSQGPVPEGPFSKRLKDEKWASEDWQDLPVRPVLADFGVAFYSLGDGSCPITDNPEDYLIRKEATRYAPEHQFQEGPPWIPLGEKTDVWGIGTILWALVAHRTSTSGPVREDHRDADKNYVPLASQLDDGRNEMEVTANVTLSGKRFAASSEYTSYDGIILKDLVRACLNWFPDDRPGLRELLDEADRVLRQPGTKAMLRDWERLELTLPDDIDALRIDQPYPLARHRPI